MRGLYITKKFDVIGKEKAILILDHTSQIIDKNVEEEWCQGNFADIS
jgi:hypothetical protein